MRIVVANRLVCAAIIGSFASVGLGAVANATSPEVRPAFRERTVDLPQVLCSEPLLEYLPLYLVPRRDPGDHKLEPSDGAWWEKSVNLTNVSDLGEWPFDYLFKNECGIVAWNAKEYPHA